MGAFFRAAGWFRFDRIQPIPPPWLVHRSPDASLAYEEGGYTDGVGGQIDADLPKTDPLECDQWVLSIPQSEPRQFEGRVI